ncbi:hypothetical protein [Arsenophonus sp.]
MENQASSMTTSIVNLLGGLVAYCLMPSKPKIPVAGTYLQA